MPFDKNKFQFISIPYLVLPFVGALGAYLSRRMKGSVVERILAALFLVFTFVALFAVRIAYGLFLEGVPYTLPHFLAGLSVTLVFIVGLGGLLLVLGAWPFCRPHLENSCPDNRAASTGNIGRITVVLDGMDLTDVQWAVLEPTFRPRRRFFGSTTAAAWSLAGSDTSGTTWAWCSSPVPGSAAGHL